MRFPTNAALGFVVATGCSNNGGKGVMIADDTAVDAGDADADTDSDTDADADADADSDADADTAAPLECVDATDCDALYGPAPCGAWDCPAGSCEVDCPGCADADRDGYGPDAACAGPDCDDADDTVFSDVPARSCYSGTPGTDGIGACRAGTESCTAGVWTPCQGEVVDGGEACNLQDDDCDGSTDEDLGDVSCGVGVCANTEPACVSGSLGTCTPNPSTPPDNDCDGLDDDCDGAIDEHCVANCVWVTPTGDDATGTGAASQPYATLGAAIAAAVAPQFVCVAAGTNCGNVRDYPEDVGMRDGIHVYGSYETTTNTRCGNRNTRILPAAPEGVLFDASVVTTTVLDGFEVVRPNLATVAAITVDGATGAVIRDVEVDAVTGNLVGDAYGIHVLNGGHADVSAVDLMGGNGSNTSIGVRVVGATVDLHDTCESLDSNGRCDDSCPSSWTSNRYGVQGDDQLGGLRAHAVWLEDATTSVVRTSAICANAADRGSGIYVTGDATGMVIRENWISGWEGTVDSHGIWLEDCLGSAPWIVNNTQIIGEARVSTALVDGVRSVGACDPVIDGNVLVAGGGEGSAAATNGVYCGTSATGASECTVLGNVAIEGSAYGNPPVSVGVRCDTGACNRIAGNTITGRGGVDVYGVWLEGTGPVIEDNAIGGGCGVTVSTGVYAADAWARLENNRIVGNDCVGGTLAQVARGLHVVLAAGVNELDVHSNVIDGASVPGACTSTGITLASTPAGLGASSGVYRNNVVRAGRCTVAAHGVFEADPFADPRVFEHNDLDPYDGPTALYHDADTATGWTSAAQVDAATDMAVSGTLDVDALFVAYPTDLHLQASSALNGAGTPTGAPLVDMDGQPRDPLAPDVGADEF